MLMVDLQPTHSGGEKSPPTDVSQRGFTIVELMMATIVFSVIMLVAAGAVVRFTSNFQRAVTATNTQNATRSIIDSISQSVQFGGGDKPTRLTGGGKTGWCVGYTRYSYVLGKQLTNAEGPTSTRYALVQDSTGIGCYGEAQTLSSGTPDGQELLGEHMRLVKFDITENDSATGVWDVTIKVVYGENEVLCAPVSVPNSCDTSGSSEVFLNNLTQLKSPDLQCKGGKGTQFCAVSEIKTTVQRRV